MDSFMLQSNATSIPFPPPPPSAISYPLYYTSNPSLVPGLSDRYLSLLSPVIIYWVTSLLFHGLDGLSLSSCPGLLHYKIHSPQDAQGKNRVSQSQVIKAVILQQSIQTILGLWWLDAELSPLSPKEHAINILHYRQFITRGLTSILGTKMVGIILGPGGASAESVAGWWYWWGVPLAQFLLAAFILDAWQYFFHRLFHLNTFLYRHVHSVHHRLYVPYAFGALYNHPLEGFVLDSLGAVVSEAGARMTTRQAMLFFTLSTLKTVQDHSGYSFPYNPIELIFPNGNDFHDLHHQVAGLKYNFSQPYFIHFDSLFGTRLTRSEFEDRKAARRLKGRKAAPEQETNGPNELGAPRSSEKSGKAIKGE